jgi:ATP-dependent DNA helicase UvrD/PcrA
MAVVAEPGIREEHLDENMQLIACAGAGKTERVALRVVAQLSLDGIDPENVVAFTYNERAAAELKERIAKRYEEARGTRDGLADLYVGTIHGYCLDLLQQHAFDALAYTVLNDVQQRLLISRNCRKCGLTEVLGWNRYWQSSTFADLMAILREGDIDYAALEGTDAGECLERYVEILNRKRYFDFSSIVSEAVAMIEEDEGFRQRVAERVRYLTVDEYQDVNPVQERLVRALAEAGAKVTVVGDDDQLLYAWRGSSASNILTFTDRYDDVEVERLERNFRSSRGVVDLAETVIELNAGERLDKGMESAGNQPYEDGDIVMEASETAPDEAAYVGTRIKELIGTPFKDRPDSAERGLSYNDVAILVRVKKLIGPIADALEGASIPYVVAGVANLFRATEALAARELFYLLAGRSSEQNLHDAWAVADLGLSTDDLSGGLSVAREDRESIADGTGRFGIYNLQRSFLRFLEAVELREEKIGGDSPSHAHRRAEVVFYNLGKFSQAISDFEQIHFQSDPQRKYEEFAGFLEYQAESIYPEGWLESRYVTPDAVQILTIHQAKGLQWPAVFVPGLTKNFFPPRGAGGISPWHAIPDGVVLNKNDYEESDVDERRLFYVACTRAKKFLTITRADYKPGEKQTYRTPSFLWDEATVALAAIDPPDPATEGDKLEPSPAESISDVGLSFSELRYAFECPYSFKLRFLYGFNPPLAEALGYGKGLHDCLFELHDRALHGGDTSEAVCEELVKRHLNVPFAYPKLERELSEKAVTRLRAYIAARSVDFDKIEHAERPVEIELGNGVRVSGRIDLIRRRDTNEVVVIDFKSSPRAQQEEVTDLQLRLYALGYRQATGEDAQAVVVDNLDDLSNPREEHVTEATLREAHEAVLDAADLMRSNKFPRRPQGADEPARDHTCERCDMAGICGTHRYAGGSDRSSGKSQGKSADKQ